MLKVNEYLYASANANTNANASANAIVGIVESNIKRRRE